MQSIVALPDGKEGAEHTILAVVIPEGTCVSHDILAAAFGADDRDALVVASPVFRIATHQ